MLIKSSSDFRIDITGGTFIDVNNTYWNQAVDIRMYEWCSYIVLAKRQDETNICHCFIFSSKTAYDYWLKENKNYEVIYEKGKLEE